MTTKKICPHCAPMMVVIWETKNGLSELLLWDGENTYWTEELIPSTGYKDMFFKKWRPISKSRFILLGDL